VTSPSSAAFWLPLLGVVALGSGLAVWAWNSRAAAFSALLLLLPLVLLLNLRVFAEGDIAHDRYLYVPSVGFVLLVALGLERLAASGAGRKRLATAAVVVLAVAYLGGLLTQSGQWRNDLSLYQRGVAVAPNNPLPRNNLANQLLKRGKVQEAMDHYAVVLSRRPNYWLANYNLGYALYRQGRYPEAAKQLSRAIRIDARDADQFLYLGLTHMRMGNLVDAEGMVRHALELNPRGYAYYMVLATVLDAQGRREQARDALAREVAQHPENKAALQLQAQWKAQE
jgi:protein O-mannosyl-transferase